MRPLAWAAMTRFLRMPILLLALAALGPARPAGAAPAGTTAARKPVLPWIEDDWTRAVATAKQRHLPIFVESWAPW